MITGDTNLLNFGKRPPLQLDKGEGAGYLNEPHPRGKHIFKYLEVVKKYVRPERCLKKIKSWSQKMSYREDRILKTNAATKAGRPQKFGEAWRHEIAEKDPITPGEYQRWIFDQVYQAGGRVLYGFVQGETFTNVSPEEFRAGKPVNCIKKEMPGQEPEYMTTRLFTQNYEAYKEKFLKIKRLVTTGYAYEISSLPFEEGAGLKLGDNKQASEPALSPEPVLKPKPLLDLQEEAPEEVPA